jgi:hypothetical protein
MGASLLRIQELEASLRVLEASFRALEASLRALEARLSAHNVPSEADLRTGLSDHQQHEESGQKVYTVETKP